MEPSASATYISGFPSLVEVNAMRGNGEITVDDGAGVTVDSTVVSGASVKSVSDEPQATQTKVSRARKPGTKYRVKTATFFQKELY